MRSFRDWQSRSLGTHLWTAPARNGLATATGLVGCGGTSAFAPDVLCEPGIEHLAAQQSPPYSGVPGPFEWLGAPHIPPLHGRCPIARFTVNHV